MSFKTTGVIAKIFNTVAVSEKFSKRELILAQMDGKFEQLIKFQFVQERCDELDKVTEGEEVTVHFDLRGREHQGNYYTNLNGWKVERLSNEMPPALDAKPAAAAPPIEVPDLPDMSDDLPF